MVSSPSPADANEPASGSTNEDTEGESVVLADFELSRALTDQWMFVGTLGFAVSLSLFGALYVAVVGEPGTITHRFSFESPPTEISYGVGPAVLAVGGAIGLAYGLARNYRRHAR